MIYYISHCISCIEFVLVIDNESEKEINIDSRINVYKCRSWYMNSYCTERTHSCTSSAQLHQQRTAAPAAAVLRQLRAAGRKYCRRSALATDASPWQSFIWCRTVDSRDLRSSKTRACEVRHTADPSLTKGHYPMPSWDDTTCATRGTPAAPMATAESSSSSSRCCSEERISGAEG